MYWREEGTKGRVVKDERTRKDFRGGGILRILTRLVVWCGGCLRHCRCCCHWRHWVLREKGGVRAVVKAPGRRLFKRRKSPSVIIRKGGIGEQQLQYSLDLEDWEFAGDEEEKETDQTESEEGSGINNEAMFFSVECEDEDDEHNHKRSH